MRRHQPLLIVAATLLLLGCLTTQAGAVNGISSYLSPQPFPNVQRQDALQTVPMQMNLGWYDSLPTWYICTDVNYTKLAFDSIAKLLRTGPIGFTVDPKNCPTYGLTVLDVFLYGQGMNFAPRLTEAAGSVATMYVNLSFGQGPLFTAIPGGATYSGVWQVTFVKFRPGVTPHVITNTDPYDPVTNPNGLPQSGVDADYLVAPSDAPIAGVTPNTPVILKCPIMAVGRLGGPWYPPPANATDIIYRIPQGKVLRDYAQTKVILLPYWAVYCSYPPNRCPYPGLSGPVGKVPIIVPDVWDPTGVLTAKLGANNGPGLAAIPPSAMQNFYFLTPPSPPSQIPVIEYCPDAVGFTANIPTEYTPIMLLQPLVRRDVPPWSIFNNPDYIEHLLSTVPPAPGLEVAPGPQIILNAPVLPPSMFIMVFGPGTPWNPQ